MLSVSGHQRDRLNLQSQCGDRAVSQIGHEVQFLKGQRLKHQKARRLPSGLELAPLSSRALLLLLASGKS